MKITKFKLGKEYNALKHSFYDNKILFGEPLAIIIENMKNNPVKSRYYKVIEVKDGCVTIAQVKNE